MDIVISKQQNELTSEEWSFWLNETTLILDKYFLFEKETKRHKAKIVKRYDRIMHTSCTLKESEVPLTAEIKLEALTKTIDNLKVLTWSEFKNRK